MKQDYIGNEFLEVLAWYISPNIDNGDGGVTQNPKFEEAAKCLWFAATGKAFPIEDGNGER